MKDIEILYDDFSVDFNGMILDICDLSFFHHIYERLCLAEYLKENMIKEVSAEFAYDVADFIRDKMDDYCECESEVIDYYLDNAIRYAEEQAEG